MIRLRPVLARSARSVRRRIFAAMDANPGKSGEGDGVKEKRVGRVGIGRVDRGRVDSGRVEAVEAVEAVEDEEVARGAVEGVGAAKLLLKAAAIHSSSIGQTLQRENATVRE